jgi:hypothetical protein
MLIYLCDQISDFLVLQAEVRSNWSPTHLSVEPDEQNGGQLLVTWREPLAAAYLTPSAPTALGLAYALEVTLDGDDESYTDVINHEETSYSYLRQV